MKPKNILEVFDLHSQIEKMKEHRRFRVFFHLGISCVTFGVKGHHVVKHVFNNGGEHIDMFTEDWTLMTIDHIHPKSKGGSDDLTNLQPMCQPCNREKGNKV